MLAQHAVTIASRSDRVATILSAPGHHWTVGLDGDGREHLARVGIQIGRLPIYKHVQLEVGQSPTQQGESLLLPVSWKVVGGPALFPRMEGILHVQPADVNETLLTLSATYDPPLGKLGEMLDRALMHRVADATIRDFVERLAVQLTAELEGNPI